MSQTVGEQLKQARTDRRLTLEQAAQTTRIRRHFLEALERGDHEALPSPVQGRGFLRLYAGYLNLPAEELVAAWEGRTLPTPTPPEPEPPKRAGRAAAPVPEPEPVDDTETVSASPTPAAGSSNAIFAEIGVTMQRQREILGLSIDEVEKHTRLRQHYLLAIEAGKIAELPSTVQSRGMLSNYAAFLNLDSDTILLRFAEGLQQRRLERMAPAPEPGLFTNKRASARPAQQARRLVTPDLIFVGGLILVLFVFIIWTAARISSSRTTQINATLPSVSDVLLYTTSPTAPTTTVGTQSAQTTLTLPSDQTAAPGTDTPPTSSPAPAVTTTLSAINSDPVQLYIVARQRAFLRVTVDGQIKFNGRTVPGSAYPFSAKTNIALLTGDAAALQVFYNQKDLGSLGKPGEPLNLSFSQQGVLTPTPTITPTVTITPLVTPTRPPGASSPSPSPSVTPLIP
jgi:cytoskeleton protein RodZ